MPIRIHRSGHLSGAMTIEEAVRALSQNLVKSQITAPMSPLTDNSTGVPGATIVQPGAVAGAANAATNLAQKAATETALGTVKNALATCYAKANAMATAVGVPTVTYNGGGTDGAGTIAAITKATTAATTGCPVATFNAIRLAYNAAILNLAHLVNRVAEASGDPLLTFTNGVGGPATVSATIAALATDTGTAVDPGVTKAEADAVLAAWANSIAKIAASIAVVVGPFGVPAVIAAQ